ncbi:MAG: hypothetical protein ACM3ML_22285 [Micromonosporaceae bacterium]
MVRLAPRPGQHVTYLRIDHVTYLRIDGGIHDLMLSAGPIRKRVYDELGRWLGAYLSGQVRDRLL